jgi:hypothetical protein
MWFGAFDPSPALWAVSPQDLLAKLAFMIFAHTSEFVGKYFSHQINCAGKT